jgi:protoheme IX farnesyltransferase
VAIGLIAFLDYVVFYGVAKRSSRYGTQVGSIAGAAPVTAGYCAAYGHFNLAAAILFIILVLWQMPHFYAIAINRLKDYKTANIPVLPAVKSIAVTKKEILIYITGFILANIALTVAGYAGFIYLMVMSVLGLAWLGLGLKGFKKSSKVWARQMFICSLVVILFLSIMLSIGSVVP